MIRLHLVVEGQTEESFVNTILREHLGHFQIATDVHCITTSRHGGRVFRGGIRKYSQIRRDLELWMKQDGNPDSFFSTMIDLYRLPQDFPGHTKTRQEPDPLKRVVALEQDFAADLDYPRFVPYVQFHEFEALMFTDIESLQHAFPDRCERLANLAKSTGTFASPEQINSGEQTSPSKRIIAEVPEYEGRKTAVAVHTLLQIGLPNIRAACGHFDNWLRDLEALGNYPGERGGT